MFLTKFKKPFLISLSIVSLSVPISYFYFSKNNIHPPLLIGLTKKFLFPKTPEELNAIFKEATYCLETLQYEKSVKLFKKAADYGHVAAAANLGALYLEGIGVERNFKEAFKYSKYAADLGDIDALNNLGFLYQNGFYVNKDVEKAIEYFSKAAKLGNPVSQFNLGKIYFTGEDGM